MEHCMGAAEQQLRDCILQSYRSVRAFATDCGLPCSTVDNVLRRGVSSVNLSTGAAICGKLGLDLYAFVRGEIVTRRQTEREQQRSLWENQLVDCCRELDDHGQEMVLLVAQKEAQRCREKDTLLVFPGKADGGDGWKQYLGAPIACRGGGITHATEKDARQMEKIYNRMMAEDGAKKHGRNR